MNEQVARAIPIIVERCDRCGARAKARAVLTSGATLHFCGHHFRAHEPRLREHGVELRQVA